MDEFLHLKLRHCQLNFLREVRREIGPALIGRRDLVPVAERTATALLGIVANRDPAPLMKDQLIDLFSRIRTQVIPKLKEAVGDEPRADQKLKEAQSILVKIIQDFERIPSGLTSSD